MREAPLFVDCHDLWEWLTERLSDRDPSAELAATALVESRRLLDHVTLALSGFEPRQHALRADELATLLRLHVRLLAERRALDDKQLLHATERLDGIGRQLGGWRKRLDSVG